MKTTRKGNPYVTWVLRILFILIILFWTMFSLDVFEENRGFRDTLLAFFMHNIPSLAMVIILLIAWKWEHVGGILLMAAMLGFVVFFTLRSGNFMYGTLFMVGIPFLIGALLVVNHYLPGKKQKIEK